jgi:DNA-binding NarL/FixJ family response regulator
VRSGHRSRIASRRKLAHITAISIGDPISPGSVGLVIRVLLADDEAMIRAGVKAILAADPEIEVVAEAGDGREAVELTLAHRPQVALLDIRMPRLDGLGAAIEIRRAAPETAVVMLTTFGEDEYIGRALGDGASGFLLKSGDPRELITGVRAVAGGAAYLSPRVAHRVISELRDGRMSRGTTARTRTDALTERERDVLALVGAGLSNAEIAKRLFLVEGTVKSYVSAILTRLGVRNRVQAAIIAYEAGLVAPDE